MKKKNRQTPNLEILQKLNWHFELYPDMRFGQALINLGIVEQVEVSLRSGDPDFNKVFWKDDFYTESSEIAERIKK